MKALKQLKSLICFISIIPFQGSSLEDAAEAFYLSPLIGCLVLGIPSASLAFILSTFMKNPVPAFLSFAFYVFLSGFNNIDGLMDFSDAIMTRGNRETKIKVIHDKYAGSFAVTSLLLNFMLISGALLTLSTTSLVKAYIAASSLSFLTAVLATYLSPPMKNSKLGRIFIEKTSRSNVKATVSFAAPVFIVSIFKTQGVVSLIASLILLLVIVHSSKKALGGINGDVLGALIELTKTSTILWFSLI